MDSGLGKESFSIISQGKVKQFSAANQKTVVGFLKKRRGIEIQTAEKSRAKIV